MAGEWESQDQELAGVYVNIKSNEPLSITPGDRGTVVILQELSVGEKKKTYTVMATNAAYPEGAVAEDKRLATEALKNAKTVILYNLPADHTDADVDDALDVLKLLDFNTISYPYDGEDNETAKTKITNWVNAMYKEEGVPVQAVMANVDADSDRVINVAQGVLLKDKTELTAAQVTAWVAGITAGASITKGNTGAKYIGAVDVVPRMSRTQMAAASKAGKFVLKVDNSQNVTIAYDINSLVTYTPEKGKVFRKNRVIRTLDNIKKDLGLIYEGDYIGKFDNEDEGHKLLKGAYCDYFKELSRRRAIKNYFPDDITISAGIESDSVLVGVNVQPVDSVDKIYVAVNVS